MSSVEILFDVDILDPSGLSYSLRLFAAALQRLVNRSGSIFFLDYGVYDELAARRTNEGFSGCGSFNTAPFEPGFAKFIEVLEYQQSKNI